MADPPVAVYADIAGVDPQPGVALLREAGFTVRVLDTADPARIAAEGADAVALLIGYARVDAELMAALPRLEIVATQSVGYDSVDVAAARAGGVWVSNVPDAATEEVASHALALGLDLVRGVTFLDRAVRAGRWDPGELALRRPRAATLGVVGLGRIGRRLAELAAPLYGRVLGHDPAVAEAPAGVEPVELDALLAEADVVSLHLPLTAQTERLLDAAALARMRPGALLVNVSRGGLVDPAALRAALDAGALGGAALDVLEQEPPAPDDPLVGHPRVVVTPHAAWCSERAGEAYVLGQARNVVAWREHGRPLHPVA